MGFQYNFDYLFCWTVFFIYISEEWFIESNLVFLYVYFLCAFISWQRAKNFIKDLKNDNIA